jgi:isocitrate/isopropylmalate dehydrogenase
MKRNKKKFVEVPLHIVDNDFDFSSLKEDEEDIYLTHENFEKISIYAVRKHITFDKAITKIIKKGMAMLPA